MFKRNPRSYGRIVLEFFYPRGGWYRAARYVIHRIRRLPDPSHRIARGIAAGVFVCFTPFFGLHIVMAMLIALVIRGNLIAAVLATFVGNPLTFPFIAELSLDLGTRMLGQSDHMHLPQVIEALAHAFGDVWRNFLALFSERTADWRGFNALFQRVLLPYTVGGLGPGLIAALASYLITNPVIAAYQKARVKRLRKRYEKRMAERAAAAAAQPAQPGQPPSTG